jgi:hypothetical protein
MGLLKPASNQTAYLKLGLQGFEGSGKTYLANDFAMGLTKLTKGTKVAFFDTEKGSDFYIKKYKEAGLELFVVRSRAFVDLITTIREAESGGYSFLIIDSITHVWRELTTAYLKKRGKPNLTMKDWVTLKQEWSQFTDLYVNSKLHIAMCGRAGYEYDMDEDEDGKKEVVKSGTKMRAEGETGFEPDLLIETYKVPISETLTDRKAKKKAKGFINRCVVIKDRSDLMNGQILDKPKYQNFLPIVKFLNLGGEHMGADPARNSQGMFGNPDRSWAEQNKQKEIAIEQIQETLVLAGFSGTSQDAVKNRTIKLKEAFGTSAKTGIEAQSLAQLLEGLERLRVLTGQKPAEVLNGIAQTEETF